MTRSRFFWIAVAVVIYPALVFGALILAVMPPLNIVLLPPWIAIMLGAAGGLSNRIAEASASARLTKRAGRLARPAEERLVEGALVAKA